MKLLEIFDQLRRSELSLLSIGGQDQGVINTSNQMTVVGAINLGLSALHTRFSLKEGNLKLILLPDVYLYTLNSRYALDSAVGESVRYIEGSFNNDLLKVESVWTDEGYELELNTRSRYACSTPSTHVLRVPVPVVDQDFSLPSYLKTTGLDLVYRANHPKITEEDLDNTDPEDLEVELPYPYLEPLLYFVAGRLHHPAGMVGDFQMGASYAAKYEQACQRLEQQNLQVDQGQTNSRLERNGWV